MVDLTTTGPTGLNMLSASEARARLDRGDITSEQLVGDCLARIEAHEPQIDAWAFVDADLALGQARARDGERPRGPLHGIPVGVKDIYDTADMPTGYGAAFLQGHQPAADSEWIATLRAAGAVILGKTRTTQFANPVPTTTRNPHDLERAPGASSSGSAAAVADFMVPLTTGSQTGGSVILPASLCGVYGYKPSFGAFPSGGVRHAKPSIDTPGLFARALDDVALMRAASIGAPFAPVEASAGAPPRIGVCRTDQWPEALPAAVAMLAQAAALLANAGAAVCDIEPPPETTEALALFPTLLATEDARALTADTEGHVDELNAWAQNSLRAAKTISADQYEQSKEAAARARAAVDGMFATVDVLITPSNRGEAPTDRTAMEPSYFNRLWTLMHLPCLSLPAFIGPAGMPVGLQLVGRLGTDERLLATGRWVEQRIAAAGGGLPVAISNAHAG